ncbi:bifunctional 3-(3-hydroxy-phenyl)propionate/3-hydroxycinnamic acid hydroxylase [Agrobacterium leguminum]|uniref:Monooxygenase FAD-binding protein n=1 Tax=Agrobacterium deltaense NCPPB 1641 TaxID=1183425 RepID=A0A1S7U6T1_9HYPH|nr:MULTISPECIES: bifunctional 3-(3-hydroxy-phenyl)propionate/3-hydroxycinnamic acid hydroxylase [Agrobacterium]WFS68688.1 bifunctional 3-(3-hydroxy-phenyl)propionate/3-hydroxycinnamic acid hydroxylase [Agrobacterium leguminum]CVI62472.1 Monooxygenase FAD-binding protein [Agrobacterium deltaense NCPPB 1641]
MNETNFDVIIIGYGPVGATLANLLGQAGHKVAIADLFSDVFELPRAVNIDQEVLRCWQRIGLASDVAEGCEPHPGTDFLGMDGNLIKYLYSAPPPYPLGWPANLMFVQPEAERVLRRGVRRFPNVTEYFSHEATSVFQDAEGVTVTLNSSGANKTIRGRWLVACDGANSPVRNWLGIGQEDLGFSEWWMVVDAWIKGETPLPARTTQYCRPDAPGAYVICSGKLRRWEMKIPPGENPEIYRDSNKIKQHMTSFVDPEALEFWRTAIYHFHARVTDRWRDGRIFLAGDAAHQMPPFLGQGLCSGVRDVANLWWKLDRVIRGHSAPTLLDTYEPERKPHIRILTEITKSLGEIVGETDVEKAKIRDRKLREEMESGRMETVRQNLIPPLKAGFLDQQDQSGLAGSLAVQPLLDNGVQAVLADDLGGNGIVVLTTAGVQPDIDDLLDRIGGKVLRIGPGLLEDVEDTFTKFAERYGIQTLIVRPDGYIWGAQRDAAELRMAVGRLFESLQVKEMTS